ncbi:hypothetical protein EAS68_07620 [Legionella jordanis]|uniref:hypothetical protein n=1 Tax=Legionella jordanis TaxID=456 RepID=UPI000F008768|nr:hypothetical protein [Legionella jordanis]RMX18675.1 hypothetical protein EAS68_07620 [Legionella jordanis]HAT8713100.1 hypothetical protein [Legionella jordanis]
MCNMKCITNGLVAGIVAGVFFAVFLFKAGMLTTLGSIIHMPTLTGGLIVHAIVSLISGVLFALILGWLIHSWLAAIVLGLLVGLLMWLIGPMTLLPYLATGAPLFSKWSLVSMQNNIPPLIGHLVYGLILAVTFYALNKRV